MAVRRGGGGRVPDAGGVAARITVGSASLRHAPFALFVVGVLAYGAAFAGYLLGGFDVVNLIRDVNVDDSFYYFQIAWRMAQGEFSTFDGITRTNGYHPLWLFLITPFYWVFDKTEALFAIKAFEVMLVAGGVALVAGAARVARLPWVLLFAALPALYRNGALFLGMEAAAALFLLGLFLLAVCLFARDPAGWRWPLAAVAFALPWVRLEYVAISVAATAALCLVEWSHRSGAPLAEGGRAPEGTARGSDPRPRLASRVRRGGWGRSVLALNAGAPLAGAVTGTLAYFVWNAVVFGGPVPVSAAAKQWMSQRFWADEGGYRLTENARAFLRTGYFDDELLVALEVCFYVAVVWWFSRRARGRDDRLLLAFLVGVSGLAAGHLAKFAQSALTVHPDSLRYDWYFVPAYLMEALVVPARCCVAIWFVRRFPAGGNPASHDSWARRLAARMQRGVSSRAVRPGRRRASRIPSLGVVTIGAAYLFATTDFTAPFRSNDFQKAFRFVNIQEEGNFYDWETSVRMGTLVMDRVLPDDSVVGTWGAGVMGYFSRFPVVNLDGLVNSWDYLRARREGTEAAFHRRYGITHLADVSEPPAEPLLFEGLPEREGRIRFRLWPAGGSPGVEDPSESFWERMEPHLERRADGVGLLVAGRLAQAFARDCPGGLVAWTWAGREEAVVLPWTQTSIGFCASAVVLPHGARPPVRVETTTAGEYLADRVGERRPAIDADFDVYIVDDTLVYAKEPCGPEDVEAPFFVHVAPVVPGDLPRPRRRQGFDNLDFRFDERGDVRTVRVGGACVVEVPLPEYRVAAVRTGQYVAAEGGVRRPWEGEIRLGPD